MKKIKELTALFFALCMLLCAAPAKALDLDAAEALSTALLRLDIQINVSAYALTADECARLFSYVLEENAALSYVSGEYTITMENEKVTFITPVYSADMIAAQSEQKRVEFAIANIISSCITPEMTDAQKALAVSDYFCTHFEYSMRNGSGAHNYALLLLEGSGVCQAYADAYTKVMQALGMRCYTVTSSKINHAWNMIVVDGEWYCVDTTWNDKFDAQYDAAQGYAGHGYLLCSQEEFERGGHPYPDNMPVGAEVTGTKYDDSFWKKIDSSVIITQAAYFYPRAVEGSIWGIMKRGTDKDAQEECVKRVDCAAPNGQSVYMGLAERGGRLYYNTASQVRSCTVEVKSCALLRLPAALEVVPEEAFMNDTALEAVQLPQGVKEIKPRAFAGCVNLKLIFIPDTVTKIAPDAFLGCGEEMCVVK